MDRDQPKRDAELADEFFRRLVSKGTYTRDECLRLTAAWVLSRRADTADDREAWEKDG